MVNGVPASGKSTVAAHLIPQLSIAGRCPLPLHLDIVKEALFAQIGTGDRDYNRMLGRASYQAIFDSINAFPDTVLPIIDAWHGFQPREILQMHLTRARIDQVVEVWVSVSPQTAAARYRARAETRHTGHLPQSYADELFILAERAQPMGFGPVISVDGEMPLPIDITGRIMDAFKT